MGPNGQEIVAEKSEDESEDSKFAELPKQSLESGVSGSHGFSVIED